MSECPETWLAARLAAGKPAETWKPVPQIDGCTFGAYQSADVGLVRSLDRIGRDGRPLSGVILSAAPSKDGYVRVKMRCDTPGHKPHTHTMQKIVLTTFDRPRPAGMETRHLHGHPEWNWYPETLVWGTRLQNAMDKPPDVRSGASRKAAVTRAPMTAAVRARTYLLETLAAGPRLVTDLQDEAAEQGISRDVLHAARRDLGLTWLLSLPVTEPETTSVTLQRVTPVFGQTPRSAAPITDCDSYVTACLQTRGQKLAPAARCFDRARGVCGVCENGMIWIGYLGRSAPCPVCRVRSVTGAA